MVFFPVAKGKANDNSVDHNRKTNKNEETLSAPPSSKPLRLGFSSQITGERRQNSQKRRNTPSIYRTDGRRGEKRSKGGTLKCSQVPVIRSGHYCGRREIRKFLRFICGREATHRVLATPHRERPASAAWALANLARIDGSTNRQTHFSPFASRPRRSPNGRRAQLR